MKTVQRIIDEYLQTLIDKEILRPSFIYCALQSTNVLYSLNIFKYLYVHYSLFYRHSQSQ